MLLLNCISMVMPTVTQDKKASQVLSIVSLQLKACVLQRRVQLHFHLQSKVTACMKAGMNANAAMSSSVP